jgi:hypothetical protein
MIAVRLPGFFERRPSKKPSGMSNKDYPPTVAGAASDLLAVTTGKPYRIPFADQRDRHPKRRTLETSTGSLSRRADQATLDRATKTQVLSMI